MGLASNHRFVCFFRRDYPRDHPMMRLIWLLTWASLTLFLGGLSRSDARVQQDASAGSVASSLDLSDPKAVEQRGDLYMVRKFYPEAVETYRRLTTLQPNNALFHNKLGIAFHQLQDLSAAKRSYRKAIQLNPQYAEVLNNLAAVEYAEKNYRSAILTYLKALAFSPSDPVVYSNLGTAYFAYDKFDYAIASYRYALLIDPAIFERTGRSGSIVHQRDIKDIAAFNFYMAKTYASLNKIEDTLLYLVKAWEEGFPDIRKSLDDPVFAFLAQEPRFLELIARLDAAQQPAAPSQPASPPR